MHSFMFRANALLTFAGSTLAVMCIAATLSDYLHESNTEVDVKLARVERLQAVGNGNDEAYLAFEINADLRSLFSWNTKQLFVYLAAEYDTKKNALNQVSLWDRIVEKEEDAVFKLPYVRNKYKLLDQGKNLRDKEVNLTVSWNIMPFVGKLRWGKVEFPDVKLPSEYTQMEQMPAWRSRGYDGDGMRYQRPRR